MRKHMRACALLLACLARTAHAEGFTAPLPSTFWLNLGGITAHSEPGYSGQNPALGIEARWSTTWAAGAGVALNSERRWSQYLVGKFTPWRTGTPAGPVDMGALAGLANHYARNDGNPIGVAAFLAELPTPALRWSLMYVPKVRGLTASAALTLSVSVRLP
jgi:hypothetical protein